MKAIQTGPIQVNTWIVPLAGNDVFIVDPAGSEATGDAQAVTRYLSSNKLTPVAVVLTHGHFDHVIGLSVIKKAYPYIKIAIHQDDGLCIGTPQAEEFHRKSLAPMGALPLLHFLTNLPQADFLLSDGQTLDSVFNKDYIQSILPPETEKTRIEQDVEAFAQWRIIHTPGHTPGSSCYYNHEQKTLVSGDTVFYHSYGRTDLFGGNEADMMQSLTRLRKMLPSDTIVYPGHDYSGFPLSETL